VINIIMDYYVYEYLRTDNTPYYVGKGCKSRWKSSDHNVPIPPIDRVRFVKTNLEEQQAKDLEIELIAKYGRKDLGTGILRNLTHGGDGSSGRIATKEMKQKIKEARARQIITEETCEKMRRAHTGRVHSIETKQKMSESAIGRKQSSETINKIKEGRKKQIIITVQVTCPHCGKQGGNRIMPRYHFDNCKNNIEKKLT
jgi:NUMOD3 motif